MPTGAPWPALTPAGKMVDRPPPRVPVCVPPAVGSMSVAPRCEDGTVHFPGDRIDRQSFRQSGHVVLPVNQRVVHAAQYACAQGSTFMR